MSSAAATLDAGERFAAYVAHELRTPLATQRVLLELALGDPNADAASWREIGEDVLRACRQQERVLEGWLALVRSRVELARRETVDLAAITDRALRTDDPSDLECVVLLEPARTTGDPDLLARLVANLVSNAIRHNVAGGRIEIATTTVSGRAVLSVANTGPRVPPGAIAHLFQAFRRLEPAGDGLGLGLAIVREIAEAHRATLSAEALSAGGLRVEVGFEPSTS